MTGADEDVGGGEGAERIVLALAPDMLFASRIRGTAEAVGVQARIVRSAEELLREARRNLPRLVLVDLDARGVDAAAAIRDLKANPSLSSVPVVAFGAHVRAEALTAAREAGADRVMARSAFVRELPALLRDTGT